MLSRIRDVCWLVAAIGMEKLARNAKVDMLCTKKEVADMKKYLQKFA